MIRATAHKTGRRWRVRVVAQGHAVATADTLGDVKRAAEALAQAPLVWERVSARHWVGREFTADERARLRRIEELTRTDGPAGHAHP